MKTVLLLVMIAACGGSGATQVPCDQISREVSQRHGACTIPLVGAVLLGCPAIQDAYCGNAANCPSGWSLSCDAPDPGVNCTYGDGVACTAGSDSATFGYVQTLNGKDGLTVVTMSGQCEFVDCQ